MKFLREGKIIEDAVRVGPLLEDVIVLEEVVMAEGGMRQHQRLHRRRVLFQQVDDARVGIDNDFVGEPLPALPVERLVAHELLAERPVLIEKRHACRSVSIEHLLGRYHLDPWPVNVEPQLSETDFGDAVVDARKSVEVPVRTLEEKPVAGCGRRHQAPTHAALLFFSKSSRKTG